MSTQTRDTIALFGAGLIAMAWCLGADPVNLLGHLWVLVGGR